MNPQIKRDSPWVDAMMMRKTRILPLILWLGLLLFLAKLLFPTHNAAY